MRCACCNNPLSDKEATRKFKESGVYTDTCTKCLKDIPIPTITRTDFDDQNEDDDLIYDYEADLFEDEDD